MSYDIELNSLFNISYLIAGKASDLRNFNIIMIWVYKYTIGDWFLEKKNWGLNCQMINILYFFIHKIQMFFFSKNKIQMLNSELWKNKDIVCYQSRRKQNVEVSTSPSNRVK